MKKKDKKQKNRTGISDTVKSASVFFGIILLWIMVSKAGIFSSYVFPDPERVMHAFASMISSGELLKNTLASMARVFTGFTISFVLAFILGVAACIFPNADPYYRPLLEFLRHIPPMSLIPLLILWFGIGETSKLIVIVLTSFFPIFMNTEAGLKGCDRKLLEVGEMLHMTPLQKFMKIRFPSAVPEILVGIQIGLGYSWRAIVGAEMIAAASGLGYMILDAQALSRSDKVIAGIIVIGTLGLLIDAALNMIIRKLTPEDIGAGSERDIYE